MLLRDATEDDLDGILAIFNQVIATSTAVWIDDPTTKDERRQWMTALFGKGYPVFVAIDAGGVAGYASFGEFRGRSPAILASAVTGIDPRLFRGDLEGRGCHARSHVLDDQVGSMRTTGEAASTIGDN